MATSNEIILNIVTAYEAGGVTAATKALEKIKEEGVDVSDAMDKLNRAGRNAADSLSDVSDAIDDGNLDAVAGTTAHAEEQIKILAKTLEGTTEAIVEKTVATEEEAIVTDTHTEAVVEETEAIDDNTKATEKQVDAKHARKKSTEEVIAEIDKGNKARKEEEQAMEQAGRVQAIEMRQRAMAFQQLGSQLQNVSRKMREMGRALEDINPKFSKQLTVAAEWSDGMGKAVSAVGSGFAVGGPIGAAVGALTVAVGIAFEQIIAATVAAAEATKKQMAEIETAYNEAKKASDESSRARIADADATATKTEEGVAREIAAIGQRAKEEQAALAAQGRSATLSAETAKLEVAGRSDLTPEQAAAQLADIDKHLNKVLETIAVASSSSVVGALEEQIQKRKEEADSANEKLLDVVRDDISAGTIETDDAGLDREIERLNKLADEYLKAAEESENLREAQSKLDEEMKALDERPTSQRALESVNPAALAKHLAKVRELSNRKEQLAKATEEMADSDGKAAEKAVELTARAEELTDALKRRAEAVSRLNELYEPGGTVDQRREAENREDWRAGEQAQREQNADTRREQESRPQPIDGPTQRDVDRQAGELQAGLAELIRQAVEAGASPELVASIQSARAAAGDGTSDQELIDLMHILEQSGKQTQGAVSGLIGPITTLARDNAQLAAQVEQLKQDVANSR